MSRRRPQLPPPRDDSKPIYDRNLDRLTEPEADYIRAYRNLTPEARETLRKLAAALLADSMEAKL